MSSNISISIHRSLNEFTLEENSQYLKPSTLSFTDDESLNKRVIFTLPI